jgi:hypothetical protein
MTYRPDIVTEGLDVIFCGINPAATAAAAGHNFSSRSNRAAARRAASPSSESGLFPT